VPQINPESLQTAWRALVSDGEGDGWRTIPIEQNALCHLMAGRHFPGGEEALLVGFRGVKLPGDSQLPQGEGFTVVNLKTDPTGGGRSWLALSRRVAGSRDFFTLMAVDVVSLFENYVTASEERLFHICLSRIRAWQDFMERHRDEVLSEEAELGLLGEIVVLSELIKLGIPTKIALEAWQGPLDSLQDFLFNSGAIEVKTTLSPKGFPAIVSSLEQLDETLRQPLFVAGVRLALGASGMSLPEFVADVRTALQNEVAPLRAFESRLVHAGYLPSLADKYVRRFSHSTTSIWPVEGDFPRLTRLNVCRGIKQARYELDLDSASVNDTGLTSALQRLGVL
jgi:hypothetical protein